MKERVLAYFITGIGLLRSVFCEGPYCTDLPGSVLISKFCNGYYLSSPIAVQMYLDSLGFHQSDYGQCKCTLRTNGTLKGITLSEVPASKPGEFDLLLAGQKVQTPVTLDHPSSPVDIILRKPKTGRPVILCIKVMPEFATNTPSTSLKMTCYTRRQIPKQQTTTVTEAPAVFDGTSDDGGSNAGVIAGATIGGLVVILGVVLVAVIVIYRKRKNQCSKDEPRVANQGGKDSYYDMTVHDGYVSADACTVPLKHEPPSAQTYEEIDDTRKGSSCNKQGSNATKREHTGHYDYVLEDVTNVPKANEHSSSKIYDEISDSVPTTFVPTQHDGVGDNVGIKHEKAQTKSFSNVGDEDEYNVVNAKKVIPPTGNIYGVALPIQTETSSE